MKKSWYAVITAEVLYSPDLTPRQKLLCAVIGNLANEKGFCFASNQYFAEMMDCSVPSIQRDLRTLENHSFINRVVKVKPSGEVEFRALTPMSLVRGGHVMGDTGGHVTGDTHNNKEVNNKENRGRAPELSRQEYETLSMQTGIPLKTVKEKAEVALLSYRGDRGKLPARPFDYVLSWILRDKSRVKAGQPNEQKVYTPSGKPQI